MSQTMRAIKNIGKVVSHLVPRQLIADELVAEVVAVRFRCRINNLAEQFVPAHALVVGAEFRVSQKLQDSLKPYSSDVVVPYPLVAPLM